MSIATNIQEQNERIAYLRRLYEMDGRDNPKHPMHGLLTGLYQERLQQLAAIDRNNLSTSHDD